MAPQVKLQHAFDSLYEYCRDNEFKGWDLFDGLNSKLFRVSPFYRSKFLRLAWIQFFKRSPVNFRKVTERGAVEKKLWEMFKMEEIKKNLLLR